MPEFVVDDRKIENRANIYRRIIRDTRFHNLYDKLGSRRGYQESSDIGRRVMTCMEKFFGVYGITSEFAAGHGPEEFSENYGFFCGALYGDSLLENMVGDSLSVVRASGLPVGKSETLLVDRLLESYVGCVAGARNGTLLKKTRGFFQNVANEAGNRLRTYRGSLEKISETTLKIGNLTLKGLRYEGKDRVLQKIGETVDEDIQTTEPVQASQFEKVSFDDMGGNYDAKNAAKEIIKEIMHPEARSFYGKKKDTGIILYGPPGTGKTMLARAIASTIDRPMYNIRVDKILDKWVGNSEKALAKLLDKKEVLFFFDEFDSLGRKKEDAHEITNRLTNILATMMEGFESNDSNTYIASTNNPLLIDQKLVRRFDNQIYVGVPNANELYEILQKQVNSFRQRSDAWRIHKVDVYREVKLDVVARAMYEKSKELESQHKVPIVGSDVVKIISRAIKRAMKDFYQGRPRMLRTEDFLKEVADFNKITLWIKSYEKDIMRIIFGE